MKQTAIPPNNELPGPTPSLRNNFRACMHYQLFQSKRVRTPCLIHKKRECCPKRCPEESISCKDGGNVVGVCNTKIVEHWKEQGDDADCEKARSYDGYDPVHIFSRRPTIPKQAYWQRRGTKEGGEKNHFRFEIWAVKSWNEAVFDPQQEDRYRNQARDEDSKEN